MPDKADLAQRVCELLKRRYRRDIRVSDRFLEDLHMDSLDKLELLMDCESMLGRSFDELDDSFARANTPEHIAEFIINTIDNNARRSNT